MLHYFSAAFGCAFFEVKATSHLGACRKVLAQVRSYGRYRRQELEKVTVYKFQNGHELVVSKRAQ